MLGSAVGSFLNVVIYRVPAGLSILYPPSRCPRCLNRLKPYDNVPVFGWLWLRGRCRFCKTPIAARYPLVEGFTGLVFLATFLHFGVTWQTLGYWAFLSWLIALALIDWDTMTLPNSLTQSGVLLGMVAQVGFAIATLPTFTAAIQGLITGLLGAVVGVLLFDAITLVGTAMLGRPAMGGGDAKLAAMLGTWLGWPGLLLSTFLACALGAFLGGGAIALGLISRQKPFAFGPFLALSGGITLFWGDALIRLYLSLFFPLAG